MPNGRAPCPDERLARSASRLQLQQNPRDEGRRRSLGAVSKGRAMVAVAQGRTRSNGLKSGRLPVSIACPFSGSPECRHARQRAQGKALAATPATRKNEIGTWLLSPAGSSYVQYPCPHAICVLALKARFDSACKSNGPSRGIPFELFMFDNERLALTGVNRHHWPGACS